MNATLIIDRASESWGAPGDRHHGPARRITVKWWGGRVEIIIEQEKDDRLDPAKSPRMDLWARTHLDDQERAALIGFLSAAPKPDEA